MSTQADKVRERAARIASRQAAVQTRPTEDEAPSTENAVPTIRDAAPPRHKPVRRTVDLGPAEHDKLDAWQRTTAWKLGRARVTGQDVLRALVVRLITDEDLSTKIRADLRAQR